MNSVAALFLLVLLAGCASQPRSPDAFTFGVVGDTPYSPGQEIAWPVLIAHINEAQVAFTIHVGDIKGSASKCSDEIYMLRRDQFNTFASPIIYTPGDNDWTDCRRPAAGSMDPLERLARLRTFFFSGRDSLGATRISTDTQDQCLQPPVEGCGCNPYPENRAWERAGIRFATINVPGSNNNIGFDPASDAEARCRNAANARWVAQAFAAAASPQARALVIALQADVWDTRKPVYRELIARVEAGATRLGKPVLFVHGDTHTYRVDFPFANGAITRLETFGSPFVGWVKVRVDPADPKIFSFEPHLRAIIPEKH